MKNQKGFTLIELIVVIAIIAILSGVVLLSVPKYFATGKDVNVKGNLSVLITDGEAFYNANNSYSSFCNPDSGAFANAKSQMPDGTVAHCEDSNSAWVACAQKFSDSKYYCVDSTGKIKEETTSCSGWTSCH